MEVSLQTWPFLETVRFASSFASEGLFCDETVRQYQLESDLSRRRHPPRLRFVPRGECIVEGVRTAAQPFRFPRHATGWYVVCFVSFVLIRPRHTTSSVPVL